MHPGSCLRRCAALFASCVVSVTTHAVAADAAQEPPIELPKFEVVDSRVLPQPESFWRYAEVPGFEILSSISQRDTRRFLEDFVLLQEVIKTIMPTLISGRGDVPTAVILTGRGKGYTEFVPTAEQKDEFGGNSLFFENAERTAIVVDFALPDIQLSDSTRIEADPYRAFYAQYFRYLIRRQIGHSAPQWLEEGLVQLFAGIDFNRKWINFGLIGDGFGGSKVGDFNELLARRGLLPLGKMFAEPKGDHLWRAQCYAFVHMCLYGTNKKLQKSFFEFVTRLDSEPLSERLFKECFHASYKDIAIELRGYLQFTMHRYMVYRGKNGAQLPAPPAITVRDATQSEVGRIKGEVLRLGGHEEAAHMAMIAPYIRGQKDPRLLAALGLDELSAGHEDRARKFLEAAAKEKAVRARAYLELARLRYKEATAKLGPEPRLDAKQVEFVLAPLVTATKQPPALPQVYEMILDVWAHTKVVPTREQFDVVIGGTKAFPMHANLLASAILLASRAGFASDAVELADRGKQLFARSAAQRERFELLSEAVKRDEKPAASQNSATPVTP